MDSIAYTVRVRELSRMSKVKLARIWRAVHPETVWTAHPVSTWNQDELINDILRAEFPHGGEVRNTINTTSRYSTMDDDFEAHALCSCGWSGQRHYGKEESSLIVAAEDDAVAHRGQSSDCYLDEVSLYRDAQWPNDRRAGLPR